VTLILNVGIRWEWSASRPSRFTNGVRDPVSDSEEAGWAPQPF